MNIKDSRGSESAERESEAGRGNETKPKVESGANVNANGDALPPHWKRTVAVIWTGQAASMLATCAATFAILWHITTSSDSALMLSTAGVAALLPTALLSPFGGVAADRFSKKHVMICADSIAGAFSLTLAIIFAAGVDALWLCMVPLVARSAAQAFRSTSLVALMPTLVPAKDMVRINTLDQALTSSSAIIGPVFGIALYTALGFTAVLALDAACAAFACLCLAAARLPYTKAQTAELTGVAAQLEEGLGAIGADRNVKTLFATTTAAMVLFLPLGTLSPLMTYGWFGGDGFQASMVEAASGIGLLAGSIVMFARGGDKKLAPVIAIAGMLLGICCVACGLLPQNAFPAFVALDGLLFAAMTTFSAPVVPAVQKRIAPEKFGRVMGVFGSLTALASPVGLLIAGPAANALDVNRWFVIAGIMLCALMAAFALGKTSKSLDR